MLLLGSGSPTQSSVPTTYTSCLRHGSATCLVCRPLPDARGLRLPAEEHHEAGGESEDPANLGARRGARAIRSAGREVGRPGAHARPQARTAQGTLPRRWFQRRGLASPRLRAVSQGCAGESKPTVLLAESLERFSFHLTSQKCAEYISEVHMAQGWLIGRAQRKSRKCFPLTAFHQVGATRFELATSRPPV
jgi:hypothetical protein